MTSADHLRLGITMRGSRATGYDEPRDALAHDWHTFLAAALPETPWMAIPNLGTPSVAAFETWGLNALILSGGEDIGTNPLRDATERALLTHAMKRGYPVLGICRGLQFIWTHLGGQLAPISGHRVTRHLIQGVGEPRFVNSYHTLGLLQTPTSPRVEALAVAEDGSLEALGLPEHPILGLMWHPEREAPASEPDLALIRGFFRKAHP